VWDTLRPGLVFTTEAQRVLFSVPSAPLW
jgi:hypothetical protein